MPEMSDTVYSIYLYNKNGAANTYGFFTSPPEVSLELEKSFSNVWISQKLHDKQSTTATITKNYYACESIQTLIRVRAGSFATS